MVSCVICIGFPKTGSSLSMDSLREAMNKELIGIKPRIMKQHYHILSNWPEFQEIGERYDGPGKADYFFKQFLYTITAPESSWHNKHMGVHYLAKQAGFETGHDYLRSDQVLFVTTRRHLLDSRTSWLFHDARQNKQTTIPTDIDLDMEEAREVVQNYAHQHLSLLDGLERAGIQNTQTSRDLSFLYEDFYRDPAAIPVAIAKAAGDSTEKFDDETIKTFNHDLSFDVMKSKLHVPGEGFRNETFEGDPGYYVNGRPGASSRHFSAQSFENVARVLEDCAVSRILARDYGFAELSPDFYRS